MSAVPRSYLVRFVQLAALWAYSVAQPTFSLLEGNPEFLVVRGASRTEVVVFALTLALVPALVVVALEWLVSLGSPRGRRRPPRALPRPLRRPARAPAPPGPRPECRRRDRRSVGDRGARGGRIRALAAGAALPYALGHPPAARPRLVRLRDAPRHRGRRRRRRRDRAEGSGRRGRLRRAPGELAHGARRSDRRGPVPELRTSRRVGDVVSARDDGPTTTRRAPCPRS